MSTTTAPTTRRRRPGARVAIGGGLLAALAVVLLFGVDDRREGYLDPDNPGPAGAQAVARVLDDEGVHVDVARGAAELADAEPGAGTTIVVTDTWNLGASTADDLLATDADRIVLIEPGPGVTDLVDLPDSTGVSMDAPAAADCPAYDGLRLLVDDTLTYPLDGCFPLEGETVLAEPRPGLTVLGAGEALTNDQVLRADNAAIALRLLGQSERLVWYVPALTDLGADDGVSIGALLPPWLRPALWLTGAAAIGLLLWRFRRLGPLAVEPLPVTVKAIETTRSRGRLYRRAGDRGHAAEVLRSAARARAATLLRTGSTTDPETLVRDIAHHTGRPIEEVADLLGPTAPTPTTDHELVALADRLAQLDREVRRP